MDGFPVDLLLPGIHIIDVVEGEGFVVAQPRLGLSRRLGDARLARVDDLLGQLRPNAGGHPHRTTVTAGLHFTHLFTLLFIVLQMKSSVS